MILVALASWIPFASHAEDIDIFVGSSGGNADAPNVLIVLDNTSNWSRQSQQWPGGIQQGQAEVRAIKRAIQSMTAANSVNVGLLEFVTKGNANDDGGYIRHAITSMSTDANRTAFTDKLDAIYNDITGEKEKRNSNTAYGNLLYDAYNYYAGRAPFAVSADVSATDRADSNGYKTSYTLFKSPLSSANSCAKNYIIFIGNSDSSGPVTDSATNTTALTDSGGSSSQLSVPQFTTTTTSTPTELGYTSGCYSNAPNDANCASDAAFANACSSTYSSCTCSAPTTVSGCSGNKVKFTVNGITTSTLITPTGQLGSIPSKYNPTNADEWAQLMASTGVPIPGSSPTSYSPVSTYAIDVFNAQQNAIQTSLLMSMATYGRGRYFAAKNEDQIVAALDQIFAEIHSVNTTFASASLPINATNRSQNANQVFIGMFRPDPDAKPRWYGNLKEYELFLNNGVIDLGDSSTPKQSAVNTQTGFINDCAVSFWTTNSVALDSTGATIPYWKNVTSNPSPASKCTLSSFSSYDKFSDLPDGSLVEKGGVSEVLRKGNNPSASGTPPYGVNRTIKSDSAGALTDFSTAASTLSTSLLNFTRGEDVKDENGNTNLTEARPSIHGDVIHSRPLPVNYGGTTGVVTYYGSNDGMLRAVEASSGREHWAFLANDFFATDTGTRLQRLMDNSPLVKFPTMPSSSSTSGTPIAKDYFFDGSIGLYQNADSSKIWIFPTQRRGGRMLYALDVTTATSPTFKWKAGCPNKSNDTGCTTDMTDVGQTWSTPNVAFVKGYSTSTPVIVMGGGYDNCEDADTSSPSCSTAKGRAIYVLNADNGEVIRSFSTSAPVAADISLIDVDADGLADYAYAADLGGNLYRIDFISSPTIRTAQAKDDWSMRKIASTSGSGRKFFFAPALFMNSNKVYLALGSGDREHPLSTNYPYTSPVTNRFYVYVDDLSVSSASSAVATDLDDTSAMANYTTDQGCSTSTFITPSSTRKGWFINLTGNGTGEQTVTSALIAGGMVTFSTNRPIPPAEGTCSTTLGEARGYWVNLFNGSGAVGVSGSCGGTRSTTFVGGGLPPSPVLATVLVGSTPMTIVIGAGQKNGSVSTPIAPQHISPTISYKRKRIYWKQSGDN